MHTTWIRSGLFIGGIIVAGLLSSCGHTNNLAQYPIADSTFTYHTVIEGRATVHSSIPSYDTTWVAHLITGIAEGASEVLIATKVERIDPAYIAGAVTRQLSHDFRDMMNCRELAEQEGRPAYVVESRVHDCTLQSSSHDATFSLSLQVRILRERDRAVVWEDGESVTQLLSGEVGHVRRGPVKTVISGINAAAIIAMSDEQLRDVLIYAAESAAATLADEVYKDFLNVGR